MAHHMGKGRLQEANYCYKVYCEMGDNSVGPGHLGCNCADSQLI